MKNLENIQGDERDVIFISVGYAKDSRGLISMNFGPLNNDGGERRLNVLITRARLRCEVFSSITGDDIDIRRTNARGVVVLKQFLEYARTGKVELARATDRGFDSPFEEAVADALQRAGHVVQSQVGEAGFFIDLAIVDQRKPGRYVLGIECDGARYHSSRCARDRDRLREQVLRDRGWELHRIWSTDWFRDPDGQLQRVLAAIEAAASAQEKPEHGAAPPSARVPAIQRAADPAPTAAQQGPTVLEYEPARVTVPSDRAIHELHASELATIVARVLDAEGPIHRDEMARRITQLWGLSRTGARIAGAVDDAVRALLNAGRAIAEGPFLSSPTQRVVPVRSREHVDSPTLRKAEYLPRSEIRAALVMVARANQGIARAEWLGETARLLGFKALGSQLRDVLEGQVEGTVASGAVEERDGRVYAAAA